MNKTNKVTMMSEDIIIDVPNNTDANVVPQQGQYLNQRLAIDTRSYSENMKMYTT